MIVVTGASRGLGAAVVERLRADGEAVLGVSRQPAEESAGLRRCDVSRAEEVEALAGDLRREKHPVTGLVNAAGIASMNLALMMPATTARELVATNLLGTIYSCQQLVPLMVRQGGGAVVNFSTIAVALGLRGESVYAASKAGVEGFTRAFAREVSGLGVRVNCVAPGPVATDLLAGVPEEALEEVIARQVLPRAFAPEEVADLVAYLLSQRSQALSGLVLPVGGV